MDFFVKTPATSRTLRRRSKVIGPYPTTALLNTPLVPGTHGGGAADVGREIFDNNPLARCIDFQPDLPVDLEDEENHENIARICDRSWTVCVTSPLFGLKYEDEFFEQWSDSLKKALIVQTEREIGLQNKEELQRNFSKLETCLEVKVSRVDGFRGCVDDHPAVKISVENKRLKRTKKRKRNEEENETTDDSKVIFEGYLLSVNMGEQMKFIHESTREKVKFLPIFISLSGNGGLGSAGIASVVSAAVKEDVQKRFDMVISPLALERKHLNWMTTLWIKVMHKDEEEKEISKTKCVHFSYYDDERKLSLKFSFIQNELIQLWDAVSNNSNAGRISLPEVKLFHKSIDEHFRRSKGISLENLQLKEVDLPSIKLNASGKIMIKDVKQVKAVLQYLTQFCAVPMESSAPSIGIIVRDDMDSVVNIP